MVNSLMLEGGSIIGNQTNHYIYRKNCPLFYDNIDTDQIIPKVHLKRVSKSGFGPFAFDEWRYLPDGSDNPDFNLINQNIMVRQF